MTLSLMRKDWIVMNNIYGLIGEKLSHSHSPSIHAMIMKACDIQGNYELFETDKASLPILLNTLKEKNINGVNVTIPYKVEIMQYIDSISSEALAIGAVNTIHFLENKTIAYNTDYTGFKMMLDYYNISIQNKKAVVLGTGGSAKAVIQCLKDHGAENIIIVSRDASNVDDIYKNFEIITYETLESIRKDLVINCTPCGMYPNVNVSPVSEKQIKGIEAAVDLIYNPLETQFMKTANRLGLKSINGLFMLVGQAVRAQEIWNDISIGSDVVEKVFKQMEEKLEIRDCNDKR